MRHFRVRETKTTEDTGEITYCTSYKEFSPEERITLEPTMSFPFELDPTTAWYRHELHRNKEIDMEHGPERRSFQARRTPQPDRYSALDRRQSRTRRVTIDTRARDRRGNPPTVTEPTIFDALEERRGDNPGRRVKWADNRMRRSGFGRRFDDERRSAPVYLYSDFDAREEPVERVERRGSEPGRRVAGTQGVVLVPGMRLQLSRLGFGRRSGDHASESTDYVYSDCE